MILIGQFDSPFVRRVGVALKLYAFAFEHRPWSTFGDRAKILPYNPLTRVPTLVLDDGEALIESGAILDHLDERAGPATALIARQGDARRRALKVSALAMGLAEKGVSLFYERAFHKDASEIWVARCAGQVADALTALDEDRAARASRYWFGDAINHADIAVACALRFIREAHPGVFDAARWPALAAHGDACEALPVFEEVSQRFIPPA